MGQDHVRTNTYGMATYNSRDLVIREDILAKAGELAELISTSEEVQTFKQAEEKIQNHERVQGLIKTIKKKQKEIVAFETFQNKDMVAKIEREIEELQEEIDGIPLVLEFQQSQSDINYLLQLVVSVIHDTVSEKVNVDEATSVIAMLVGAADALSAARPGARRETLETYIRRLEKLEEISESFEGVEKSYAIQAGREVRVMVQPEKIDDAEAFRLARDITKTIENELD